MKKVAVIDYGMSNIDSISRALDELGADVVVTHSPGDLEQATHIVLPGVGSFSKAMKHLNDFHFPEAIRRQAVENRIPFLGICLGMQLLAGSGEEGGQTHGLDLIPGRVTALIREDPADRIPHVGWNEVVLKKPSPLFHNIPSRKDFYFVHSYHFVPENPETIAGETPYCGTFVSAVRSDNIFGVQFHPEKSQRAGFDLLQNFLSL